MTHEFSILGRGRAGRSLAKAWGDSVTLLSSAEAPEGFALLAVPDDAISAQADRFPGRCAHLSGSFHLEGVPCAHPLTSFDGEPADWRGTPLALTGNVPEFLVSAFQKLGFEPFQLEPGQKALYHAAAVLTSAHSATLWLGAAALLRSSGVELPGRGLMPLVEATRRNIERHGDAGRTGPFIRGDEATIARDAAALPKGWREIFLKLGHLG
ncbi:MAG: DUF2520 domain-containing protein [Holophagaceae bacterium]|nr:DUF2520 domain-containing protein [Holophagaceae bacterium]